MYEHVHTCATAPVKFKSILKINSLKMTSSNIFRYSATTLICISISDSVDNDDYLYNCYRALYDLFYRSGLRLYHTAASDSLCLQVTMMASCTYYLSFIKNPGDRLFVMHPPADFGKNFGIKRAGDIDIKHCDVRILLGFLKSRCFPLFLPFNDYSYKSRT